MIAATASATDDFLNSLNINDTIDDVMAETEPQQSPKPIKQVYNLTESLESLKNFKNSISEITQQKLEDFNDKLKTSRNENVKIVKVASNNGIELITNDFNKLLKSYEDFLSNNDKEINQESIKTRLLNKIRSNSQSSINNLFNWQNEIDDLEIKSIESALKPLKEKFVEIQRELGSMFAWTDGITYEHWQEYHQLLKSELDINQQFFKIQEEVDELELIFDEYMNEFVKISNDFESKVGQIYDEFFNLSQVNYQQEQSNVVDESDKQKSDDIASNKQQTNDIESEKSEQNHSSVIKNNEESNDEVISNEKNENIENNEQYPTENENDTTTTTDNNNSKHIHQEL